jgi:phage/plasmid-associated DNA primase
LADKELRAKLRTEAPGILYALIQGCLEYQRIGLFPPATVIESSEEYLREQNLIARFLDERCDQSPECSCGRNTCLPSAAEMVRYGSITAHELWAALTQWAPNERGGIGHRKNFNSKVEDLGVRITRVQGKSRHRAQKLEGGWRGTRGSATNRRPTFRRTSLACGTANTFQFSQGIVSSHFGTIRIALAVMAGR